MAKKNSENHNWKGGKAVDNRGYVFILAPGHPNAVYGNHRYVPEHRLVMSNHLGRPLSTNEVVHHINGNKADNRLENLVLISRAAHPHEHFVGNKHPLWKGGCATLCCLQCGKEFSTGAHNRNDKAKYCSWKYYWDSMRAPPRICQTCGNTFQPVNPGTTPGKYCSMACAGKARRKSP